MNPTTPNQTKPDAAHEKPNFPDNLMETLSQQVTKGLSQPPSRAQVPPGTAAEEIVQ